MPWSTEDAEGRPREQGAGVAGASAVGGGDLLGSAYFALVVQKGGADSRNNNTLNIN